MTITRQDRKTIRWAAGLVGIPWESGGRDPLCGLDCWGLVCFVYRQVYGLELPPYHLVLPEDTLQVAKTTELEAISPRWTEVDVPELWNVVGLSAGSAVHHVGVWLLDGVLHATPNTGVVYQSPHSLRHASLRCRRFWRHD